VRRRVDLHQHRALLTAADNPASSGDPSQRLSYVVRKSAGASAYLICDTDYKAALEGVGQKIITILTPACLSSPIAEVLHPDCTVEDVTHRERRPRPHSIPFCDDVGGTAPCWRLCNAADRATRLAARPPAERAVGVPASVQPARSPLPVVGVNIERGGVMAPANTTAKVACNTIAIANEDPTPPACSAHPRRAPRHVPLGCLSADHAVAAAALGLVEVCHRPA